MRLLLDQNLAPRIARALNALFDGEHEIIALRDKFSPNTPDVTWIDALDQDRGWAVLTRDINLRTRPHERAALDRARIVFFFLAGSWRSFSVEETTARLIRLMPKIIAQTSLAESGPFELPITRARCCGRTGSERHGYHCSALRLLAADRRACPQMALGVG